MEKSVVIVGERGWMDEGEVIEGINVDRKK